MLILLSLETGKIKARLGASTSQSNTLTIASLSLFAKLANEALIEVFPTPPLPEITAIVVFFIILLTPCIFLNI